MPSEPRHFFARAFGLIWRSMFALPELEVAEGPDFDVDIVEEAVPERLAEVRHEGVRYQAAPGQLLLRVDQVARYRASEGSRVSVQPMAGADLGDVRLFLYGSIMAAIFHQREIPVLHGSAVVGRDGRAMAFLGASGIGKSTLATALARRGYPVLTDDLCVLRHGPSGQAEIQPGIPRAKLWLDALRALEISADDLPRVRAKMEKRAWLLDNAFAHGPAPVSHVYFLHHSPDRGCHITPLAGADKMASLQLTTYRRRYLDGLGRSPQVFQLCLELASRAQFKRLSRPAGSFDLEALIACIESDTTP